MQIYFFPTELLLSYPFRKYESMVVGCWDVAESYTDVDYWSCTLWLVDQYLFVHLARVKSKRQRVRTTNNNITKKKTTRDTTFATSTCSLRAKLLSTSFHHLGKACIDWTWTTLSHVPLKKHVHYIKVLLGFIYNLNVKI